MHVHLSCIGCLSMCLCVCVCVRSLLRMTRPAFPVLSGCELSLSQSQLCSRVSDEIFASPRSLPLADLGLPSSSVACCSAAQSPRLPGASTETPSFHPCPAMQICGPCRASCLPFVCCLARRRCLQLQNRCQLRAAIVWSLCSWARRALLMWKVMLHDSSFLAATQSLVQRSSVEIAVVGMHLSFSLQVSMRSIPALLFSFSLPWRCICGPCS